MVGADHAIASVDGGAFDDGQNVALHAFAGDVRAVAGLAAGDFVHFVNEENAHLLDAVHGDARDLVHINQAVFFFLDEIVKGFGDRHFALLFLLAEHAGEHVFYIDVHFLDALIGDDFEGRHLAFANFDFDHARVELAFAQLGAKFFPRASYLFAALNFRGGRSVRRNGRRREEQVEQAVFGGLLGALGDFVELFFTDHINRGFDEIADHGFHVAADVADFGVFRGFHFDEGETCQAREAAGDFRLADASGADHQNIFRQNIFGELGWKFLPADPIAQSDGYGFFGEILADDIFIQLDDDFARGKLVERRERFRLRRLRFVSGQVDDHVFLRFLRHSSSTLKLSFV